MKEEPNILKAAGLRHEAYDRRYLRAFTTEYKEPLIFFKMTYREFKKPSIFQRIKNKVQTLMSLRIVDIRDYRRLDEYE